MSSQERILEVIDSLRPYIQADGGDVELLNYDEQDGIVQVRLMGACESCPISMMTLKEGLEKRIKSTVPSVTEVMAV
jgi:Fe-S cluster biogenesis protein NfuA